MTPAASPAREPAPRDLEGQQERGGEARWLNPTKLEAWQGLTYLTSRLTTLLNRQLQVDHDISLADYEVMGRLASAPEGRLRVGELRRSLSWEQSRLSHQLTGMQKRGLIAREECLTDRRGTSVTLTSTGTATIEAAAPSHVAAVRELLLDHLDPNQIQQLAVITRQGIASLDEP